MQTRFRWIQALTSSASREVLIGGGLFNGCCIPVSPQPQNNHLCKLPQWAQIHSSLFHCSISKLMVPCIVLDDSGVTGTGEGGRAGGCHGAREGFYQSGLLVFLKLNKMRPAQRQTSPLLTIGFSYSLDPDSGFFLCLLQHLSGFKHWKWLRSIKL